MDYTQVPKELQDVYLRPRELEVIKLLAQSNTTKQIADILGVTIWAVQRNISEAQRRMGATTYNLVYKAHQMGVLD